MTGRATIAGLCVLCAFGLAALAAQTASAAIAGTTAFTCIKAGADGKETFKTAHCKKSDGSGEFGHKKVAQDTTTDITATNEKTNAETTGPTNTLLHLDISGIKVELQATGVHGEGTLANKLDAFLPEKPNEHWVHGTVTLKFTGVSFINPTNCSVEGGTLTTKPMTFTTTGTGDNVKFAPKEGTVFAEFTVTGSECPEAIKGLYKVTGSFQGQPDGATINFDTTTITFENTLKIRNIKCGLSSKLTVSGTDTEAKDTAFTPIGPTTIETP